MDARLRPRSMLLGAVVVFGTLQIAALTRPTDLQTAATGFVVGWVLCVALLASRGRGGVYSPAAAYVIVFGLFHGGLLLSTALRGGPGLPGAEDEWFFGAQTPVAATLASIGMLSFTLVAARSRTTTDRVDPPDVRESRALGILGLGVLLVGLAVFASLVLRGGGSALTGYSSYLEVARGDGLLAYGILAIGIGPVLAIAAGGRARTSSWTLFVGYAAVAFPLGLRGEVLFPLVAMLVVEVRRGRRIRPAWTIGGTLAVMTLIGVVRQTRHGGVGALFNASTLGSPMNAVAEMGYSLRPTVVVLGWHERGEPLRGGDTFLAVPARALEEVLGGSPPSFDDRLFNVEIMARSGPIGGSPVAEAYHNFGAPGVVAVMALLGLLVALLTRMNRTPRNDAFLGAIFVVLLIQVRNSFAPVPLQIVLVLGLFSVARFLAWGPCARSRTRAFRAGGRSGRGRHGLCRATTGRESRSLPRWLIGMADARRVVHVFGVMDRGGAELRTVEVVERLGRRGIDTIYVTLTGREGTLAERIRRSGDRVVPIGLDIGFPVRFLELLRAEEVDVVHSHVATFSGATLALAWMAGIRRRIAHFRSDGDGHHHTRARRVQRSAMKILLDLAATDIVGVSPGALDHGWRPSWRSDPRCRVIANGIDTATVPPVEDRQAVRAALGIGSDARVVCHVGRSAPVKNRARAVELACHPGISEMVVLLVGSVGDGEARYWEERGGKALRVLGERTDVLRLLNAADLTLVTSTREGLPGVVLESLAVGTPVVASDLPGVRWIAESVPGIEIRRLDEPNAAWVASIVAGVGAADRPARRVRLRASFAGSRFLLTTVAHELDALWGGSGTEETCG